MIKINLIGDRRPAVARRAKPKLALGAQNISIVLLGVGALVGLLISGGWWWTLKTTLEEEQARVVRAKEEVKQLEEILKEVEAFKAKKADLTTRINVIKELTVAQRGPVAIMDGISRSLPDLLWLQTMVVDAKSVTLTGQAMNVNAIASFIESLAQVPEFKEPDTKEITEQIVDGQQTFKFNLSFPYALVQPEEPAAAAPAPGAPATPAATKPALGPA